MFREEDYSPERLAERYAKYMHGSEGFASAYSEFLRNGGEAFRTILLHLANPSFPQSSSAPEIGQSDESTEERKDQGILIHCTAGKDRTGIFLALLFSFLGVPRDAIADEYNLTDLGLRHMRDSVVRRLLHGAVFQQRIVEISGNRLSEADVVALLDKQERGDVIEGVDEEVLEKGREAAESMIGARRESMMAALEMLDGEFGGAERYLRVWCGLGDGELEGLRRNLIVEGER